MLLALPAPVRFDMMGRRKRAEDRDVQGMSIELRIEGLEKCVGRMRMESAR